MEKVIQIVLAVVACGVILMCLLPLGGGPFLAPIMIAFGWIGFLFRVALEIRPDPIGLVSALIGIVVLFLGTHWLARSLRGAERPWPWRWTVGIVSMVLVMFVAGMSGVGLWQTSTWLINSDEPMFNSGARVSFQNNLRQVTLAANNYHSDHNRLPVATTYDANGTMLHGWQTQVLPYIEQKALYDSIDQTLPWNHPNNMKAMETQIKTFLNSYRSDHKDADGYALSHIAGNSRLFDGHWTLGSITHGSGTSHTILAAEVKNPVPWGHPRNVRDPALGFNKSPRGFGGDWPGGVVPIAFVDGSVRTFKTDDPDLLKILGNPKNDP